MKQSDDRVRRAIEMFKTQNRAENATKELLGLAARQLVVGRCQEAKATTKSALALYQGRISLADAALVYAGCNDPGQAQVILNQLRTTYPSDTIISAMMTPLIQAEIERGRGNIAEAIRLAESVRSYDRSLIMGFTDNYIRGLLYLEQRRSDEASEEFKQIVDNPTIDPFSPLHALAHLCLGRAAVVNNDTAGARKAYQDFFALWKDADSDLPVLVQAHKEYDALK